MKRLANKMADLDIWLTVTGLYLLLTSVCAILGRMTSVRWLYDWGDGVGMAYTTAVNFMVCGVAFLLAAQQLRVNKSET